MVTISRVEHAGKIRGAGRTSAGSNDGLTAENTGCDFVRLAKEGLLCGVFVCTEILFNIFLKDAKTKIIIDCPTSCIPGRNLTFLLT